MTETMTILTTAQAAAVLGIGKTQVKQLCRLGKLQAVKGRRGVWEIDEAACYAYVGKKRPHVPMPPPPIGRGAEFRHGRKQVWTTVDEQIAATMRGDIRPLYLTALGEVIK